MCLLERSSGEKMRSNEGSGKQGGRHDQRSMKSSFKKNSNSSFSQGGAVGRSPPESHGENPEKKPRREEGTKEYFQEFVEKILDRLDCTRDEVKQEIASLRLEAQTMRDELKKEKEDSEREKESWKREVESLKMNINRSKKFEEKLNMQERRDREKNIIIRGIEEEQRENTENKVKEILKEKLKVEINLARAERIGKARREKDRPLIFKFEKGGR